VRLASSEEISSFADEDLELRKGPGVVFLAVPTFLPSVISSFLLTQKRRGRGCGAPEPLPQIHHCL